MNGHLVAGLTHRVTRIKLKLQQKHEGCAGKCGSPAALTITQSYHHSLLMTLETENAEHSTYSKIPLIQFVWDRTGADLSNILDYHTVLILT
jgi:hypothetical protein